MQTAHFDSENTNCISAQIGSDFVYGFGGNNHFCGSSGNEIIYGSAGTGFIMAALEAT